MRKNITATILALLALSMLTLTLKTQPVKADPGYIHIRSDGSIDPSSAFIQRNGDYYNLTSDLSEGIIIERNNMTLDGSSYKISGASYTGIGVNVTGISHVMLENLIVHNFQNGIAFINSNFCQLYHSDIEEGNNSDSDSIGVNVTNSAQITLFNDTTKAYRHGIKLFGSSYNRVFNCTSRFNNGGEDGWGIDLASASNFNNVFDNYVAENHDGIGIQADDYNSSIFTYNNSITYNTIYYNSASGEGIGLYSRTCNNTITRNNFVNNPLPANVDQSYNDSWDGGYPSYTLGGNYWFNYNGTDLYHGPYQNVTGSDGIGDTAYVIPVNNTDHYPLIRYNYTYRHLTTESAGNGTTDPVPDTYPISYPGMNMTVTPLASPGFVFDHWLLDGTTNKTDNPITIAMDSDHTLRAYFTEEGGGCPYLSVWNGSGYVLDNNLLPASETGNGTDARDYYLLQQPLVPMLRTQQVSVYSLQIREFENEQDHIDQVKLTAVDHAQGTSVAVTPEGQILTYTSPATPITCIGNNGLSHMTEIDRMDGNVSDPSTYFQGNKGDWLVLDFGRVTGPTANLILRDDMLCDKVCLEVQVQDANGDWQTVETLHPRAFWSMEAVNMTAYLPPNADFIVRLLWTATHRVDYVGLDTSTQAQTTVSSARPILAVHSTMGVVTTKLLYDDESCVELVNGQQITMAFMLPTNAQGVTRDFIFYTDGYYYTISP